MGGRRSLRILWTDVPAFLVPLYESNDCHNPAGPGGGRFCGTMKKGWHLTADPRFKPDPAAKPEWASLGGDLMGDNRPAGLFVGAPEYWMQAHGYERPYVAQVEGMVTNPPGSVMHKGREEFMQGEVKTLRVLTIDEYAREVFGEGGWVEEYFSKESRPKKMPKGYVGRPVSDMSPAEIAEWERKFAEWTRRSR